MLHIVLDAARMEAFLSTAQKLNTNFRSLYKGQSEKDLAVVAPYLFSLSDNEAFRSWLLEKGWGNAWGIYAESSAPPKEVYRHFRRFLVVRTESGKELYFRFYDPRVLQNFLPTCDSEQLVDFFGSIRYFLVEKNTDTAIRFEIRNGRLNQEVISRSEAEQLIR